MKLSSVRYEYIRKVSEKGQFLRKGIVYSLAVWRDVTGWTAGGAYPALIRPRVSYFRGPGLHTFSLCKLARRQVGLAGLVGYRPGTLTSNQQQQRNHLYHLFWRSRSKLSVQRALRFFSPAQFHSSSIYLLYDHRIAPRNTDLL